MEEHPCESKLPHVNGNVASKKGISVYKAPYHAVLGHGVLVHRHGLVQLFPVHALLGEDENLRAGLGDVIRFGG